MLQSDRIEQWCIVMENFAYPHLLYGVSGLLKKFIRGRSTVLILIWPRGRLQNDGPTDANLVVISASQRVSRTFILGFWGGGQ